MTPNYAQLLTKIKEIGNAIHKFSWKAPDIGVSKQRLTEHDIKTERELCKFIQSIDKDAIFFAEEEHEKSKESKNLRIIDPISNTFNFIHGLPHYSVCVSHMLAGEMVFAVVYDPSMQELFHAEKWKWSYLNGQRIHVSDNTTDLSIIINQRKNLDTTKLIEKFQTMWGIRSLWSLGVHYAYVACGRTECAISLPKDIFPEMAGKLLVEEAWGTFTNFEWNEVGLESTSIIASNKLVHAMILEKLK